MTAEPSVPEQPRDLFHRWGPIAVMAVVYYGGARVGALIHIPGTNAGLFWPPVGIALALMLLWGYRTWPGILVGSAAAILPPLFETYTPIRALMVGGGELVADVVPVVLAVHWIRGAIRDRTPFARPREVVAFVLWGGVIANALSASIGVASIALGGKVQLGILPLVGVHWFLSGFISVLVLTPFCYVWISDREFQVSGRFTAYVLVLASSLAATLLVFTEKASTGHHYFEYLTIFFVALAPFAVGLHGSTAVTLVIGSISIWATVTNLGPFVAATADQSMLLLSGYVATVALVGLILSSLISERRQAATDAQAAVEASEARLRSILESSPLPIAWTDNQGKIEFYNRRAQALFGWTMEEMDRNDKAFERFFPDPERRKVEWARWRKLVDTNKPLGRDVFFETDVMTKDGTSRNIEIHGTVVGERLVVTFNDLTERKKNEAQREELSLQVARSHKIESLGRLAGGVAHDLNNLLVPILGYAQMLSEDTAPGTGVHDGVLQIKEAGERARDLTRQLLAFGRKQVLDFQVVDLTKAIVRFERLLRRTIREDIRFELVVPETPGKIRADVGQLEQVIMNLTVNAQQAMPDGGALTIEVSAVEVSESDAAGLAEVSPGPYVLLRVSDTGKGMEKAVLERAFEPFYTTKKPGEGTGLGLAIVHGIVKQHGGHIFVDSVPGQGVTFRIYLPRVDDAPTTSDASIGVVQAKAGGHQTILLAEDEASVRQVVTLMLQRLGYRVLAARDVHHCLELAEHEETIALLLTDVVMPVMDGKQLYEKLSARRPGLKVLYMSGHPRDVLDRRGVAEELRFLAKPISPDSLSAAVRQALSAGEAQ